MTWFNKLPRLVQIILLLIPGVNWVVETYSSSSSSHLSAYMLELSCTLSESAIMEKINFLEEYFNNRPDMILCSYKTNSPRRALSAGRSSPR